jgi:hypothetical protein
MQRGGYRPLAGRMAPVLWVACCLMAAGCASIDPTLGTSQPLAASISFESIDGPPQDIAHNLLASLNEEAAAYRLTVLPPGSTASYRIRGYLAAHPQGGAETISWAWDVYDAGLRRAFRLGGEERMRGEGWAAADQAAWRRLAHAGIEQLAALMAAPPAAPAGEGAPAPPRPSGAVVARR